MKKLLLTFVALLCILGARGDDRTTSLLNAKHLTLTLQQGDTYYYLVSTTDRPMLRLGGDSIVVERDTFLTADIAGMRLQAIPRFTLDEDSEAYDRDMTVSHGLLALRRTILVNQWNAVVLPIELTGSQILDAFGEGAQVARVRGFHPGSNTTVDYETLDLNTSDPVMLPNCHYIIRPTREADVAAGETGSYFGGTKPVEGPCYVIAEATLQPKQGPKFVSYASDDQTASLSLRGTYSLRDGSSTKNTMVQPGNNIVYAFNAGGFLEPHTDAVAVKAFGSWFVDLSAEPQRLHFYIDGVGDDLVQAIHGITLGNEPSQAVAYDLQGRRVDASLTNSEGANGGNLKKGIYIINGKKTIVK